MGCRQFVCQLEEIPHDRGLERVVAGKLLALFRHENGVIALDGICPHAGGPLAHGMLRDGVVTCPWHGWQYHITTGQHVLNAKIRVPTFPVKVEGNEVFVELPDPT